MEAAVQLVEQHGGESTVLTLGPAEADEQLRYAASIGVDQGRAAADRRGRLGPAAHRGGDRRGHPRPRGRRRSVRPHPVRQRVGRLRQLPDRCPRRPRARSSDGQRHQGHRRGRRHVARPARGRRRRRGLRGADAVRARREGRHQPAALPDAEGPAGVEEGRRRPGRARRPSPAVNR